MLKLVQNSLSCKPFFSEENNIQIDISLEIRHKRESCSWHHVAGVGTGSSFLPAVLGVGVCSPENTTLWSTHHTFDLWYSCSQSLQRNSRKWEYLPQSLQKSLSPHSILFLVSAYHWAESSVIIYNNPVWYLAIFSTHILLINRKVGVRG